MSQQQSPKVKSADRVLDIFELYTGDKDAFTLTEIAKALNMPISSTYQIIQNMLNRGYLETDGTGKQFRLGNKIFEIRVQHRKNTNLPTEFFSVAGKMAEELNETVMLSVRSGDKVVYIAEKSASQPIRVSSAIGSVLPLHASASGKMLLSSMSEEEIDRLYPNKELEKITSRTISHVDQLKEELAKVRAMGMAYNFEESVEGVHCVAGPIYDMEGHVVASVSVSIPIVRITDDLWERTQHWIKKACQDISNKVYRLN
jgi:DNA-binding IclR family transcriptional regulator